MAVNVRSVFLVWQIVHAKHCGTWRFYQQATSDPHSYGFRPYRGVGMQTPKSRILLDKGCSSDIRRRHRKMLRQDQPRLAIRIHTNGNKGTNKLVKGGIF